MRSFIEIDRPIAEVFDFLQDGQNTNRYLGKEFAISPILKPPSTDGQYRLGSRVLGQGSFAGVGIKLLYRVTVFEQNKIVHLQSEDKTFDSQVTWKFIALSEVKTRVILDIKIRQKSGLMGFMTNLVISQIEPMINSYLYKSLQRLKKVVEVTVPAGVV